MYSLLFLILGFVLLYYGGEFLVKGSVNLANKFSISKLVAGMTIVSFATSSPELFVSIEAILNKSSDIVFGNVIGSNIANIALVLGCTALFFNINVTDKTLKIDFPFLFFATFSVGYILYFLGKITFFTGLILIILLTAYLFYIISSSRNENNSIVDQLEKDDKSTYLNCFTYLILGIILLKYGADFLVSSAIDIAILLNIEERIIAVTVVAIGTSVPELATSIVAALKKEVDLAVGNIVGSNIFNLLAVLGITALYKEIEIMNNNILSIDYLFMFIITVIFGVFLYTFEKGKINKLKGGILLLIYFSFIYYSIIS
ncbi:MAG: calcium/sodium antiporter [Flavobacteriales bacterium]